MRGRPRIALLLVALLFPLAGATPPTPVSGEFALAGQGAWTGEVSFITRDQGALSLAHPADLHRPLVVEWGSARGYLVQMSRAGTPVAGGYYAAEGATNETLIIGPGRLLIACKPGCEALLTAQEGGALAIAGRAAGPLGPANATREYAGWSRVDGGRDDFYYHAPAEAHAIGGGALAEGRAHATGALGLFVDHARVTLDAAGRARDIDLGRVREPVAEGPLSAAPLIRIRDRFLVLELRDARWSAEDTHAILYAAEARGEITGALVGRDATGEIRSGSSTREFTGERVALEGALQIHALERRADRELLGLEREGTRVVIDGVATRIRVGNADLPVVFAGSQLALPLAVAAAVLFALVLAAPWIPFYSRLQGARLLENPTRARIMTTLRDKPGLTPLALARELGIARAVALHHLAALKAHRLVVERRVGWATPHFVAETAPDPQTLAMRELLADDTRRRIASEVAMREATQADLAAATGVQQRLVSYHLAKLEAAGLVDTTRGRPRRFAATPRLRDALTGRT